MYIARTEHVHANPESILANVTYHLYNEGGLLTVIAVFQVRRS
jgi:hypothetical protein